MSKRMSNEAEFAAVEMKAVPLSEVFVDESRNLRRFAPDPASIQDLANRIVTRGQLQPVVVTELTKDGAGVDGANGAKYRLEAGYRRYKAIALANENGAGLPILIRVIQADDVQALLSNLEENIRRKELTYMDSSSAIKTLREKGLEEKHIAQEFGKSQSWVSQVAYFVELRPAIQQGIASGKIPLVVARQLRGLGDEEQDDLIKRALEAENRGESAGRSRVKAKGKDKRGRKAKEEKTSGRALSGKQALSVFEQKVETLAALEKRSKADEKVISLCQVMVKFLTGALGAQATMKRLEAML